MNLVAALAFLLLAGTPLTSDDEADTAQEVAAEEGEAEEETEIQK